MKVLQKEIDGFKINMYANAKGMSADLYAEGVREPEFMWILKTEASGELAIDVGANIGYTTLYLCRSMNKVIAIEPDNRTRILLKKNIRNNGFEDKTTIQSFAISNKKSTSVIYYAPRPNLTTLNAPVQDIKRHKVGSIKTRTIDGMRVLPNFVKMDIEGYEIEAIEGGLETFAKTPNCKILIEVHPQFYSEKRNFADVLRKLLDIGYHFKYVVSAAVAQPTLFKEKDYTPFRTFKSGEFERGVYESILAEDAIFFCSQSHCEFVPSTGKTSNKIVRSILLVK